MNIEFDEEIDWSAGLEGVVTSATVDGEKVYCVLEGRVIAKHFGMPDNQWQIQKAYLQNRSFLEGIIHDAIERGMVDERNELLLGEDELRPYLEKAATPATAPA